MDKDIEVLIVEDDLRIADIHRRFIDKIKGFQVIGTAANGEQAKDWIEAVSPKLILLDVYLPDIRGIDLVSWIRLHFKDTDIIMVTAASEIEVVQKALRGGVFDYILKPLTYERFEYSLENYRNHIKKLSGEGSLSSQEIESFWMKKHGGGHVQEQESPKGIDPLTLKKVMSEIFNMEEDGMTAEEVSRLSGVSRSTARRYLEYLISQKRVKAELIYGNVGRPERRYYKR